MTCHILKMTLYESIMNTGSILYNNLFLTVTERRGVGWSAMWSDCTIVATLLLLLLLKRERAITNKSFLGFNILWCNNALPYNDLANSLSLFCKCSALLNVLKYYSYVTSIIFSKGPLKIYIFGGIPYFNCSSEYFWEYKFQIIFRVFILWCSVGNVIRYCHITISEPETGK